MEVFLMLTLFVIALIGGWALATMVKKRQIIIPGILFIALMAISLFILVPMSIDACSASEVAKEQGNEWLIHSMPLIVGLIIGFFGGMLTIKNPSPRRFEAV